MNLELTGHVAVVAGAANGIGQAIARAFAGEGAHVALLDRDPNIANLAEQWRGEYRVKLLPLVTDVTDYAGLGQAARRVEQELGPVEHVVYAVGIGSGKTGFPFWNIEPHEWAPVLQVNLLGAVQTVYAFMQPMIERRRGTFLFLGSVAGQVGSQTDPPYSASKAALINFSQCAAKDLAPYNIRVNTLNPGMVDTALSRRIWAASNHHLPPEQKPGYESWAAEKLKRMVPLNRWQEPGDIAAMAVFLASIQAKNITGQTINVDGGYVMHS
jgi:NAD(P)-dependent dehydrogenase (short-subunit alcohol dehydrogenase family)